MYCQQTETCLNHIENLLNIEEKLKKLVFENNRWKNYFIKLK